MRYLIFLLFSGLCGVDSQKTIPEYLRECYENQTFHAPRLPMNLKIIIDILRRAEKYSQTSMDLRAMTVSMLHRFKFDGIEYYSGMRISEGLLPFGGTGLERSKNRMVEELVPGNPLAFPAEALTVDERCTLHRALSNTIWEHADPYGDKLCTEGVTEKLSEKSFLRRAKMCPLEFGVVLTPFGTVALGTVISGIAASLQPQNVTLGLLIRAPVAEAPGNLAKNSRDEFNYNEEEEEEEVDLVVPRNQMALDRSMWLNVISKSTTDIDNVWVSTVAGDLAEMAVYQGPVEGKRMLLGATGFWNSSMRPEIFYLVGRDGTFDATRAEIIGGIDGLVIAKKLPGWLEKFPNLRLSQIIDMHYSDKGSIFDASARACDRGLAFRRVAPRSLIEEQTLATSQILAYRRSVAYMEERVLRDMVRHAVDAFDSYTTHNLFTEIHCRQSEEIYPRVEALVAFDGSWSPNYTADFLSVLADDLDVCLFGSKIGILDGSTGDWLLNVTDSLARFHHLLATINRLNWPSTMNFQRVLDRVSAYLDDFWENKQRRHSIGNLGQVVVFLAPRVTLNDAEQGRILKIIQALKSKHPDLYFLYYASDSNGKLFKPFLLTEEDRLVESSSIDDLIDVLHRVPRVLRPAECNPNVEEGARDQIEDYVGPRQSVSYRLHPRWRRNTKKVEASFHTVGYGTIEICTWNQRRRNVIKNNLYCRRLSGHGDSVFIDFATCDDDTICNNTYYEIKGVSSERKCTEIDCRTPDYIRYIIRVEKLYCSAGSSSSLRIFLLAFCVHLSFH